MSIKSTDNFPESFIIPQNNAENEQEDLKLLAQKKEINDIAIKYIDKGKLEEALKELGRIPPNLKDANTMLMLATIAKKYLVNNDPEKAKEVAKKIPDEFFRERQLKKIEEYLMNYPKNTSKIRNSNNYETELKKIKMQQAMLFAQQKNTESIKEAIKIISEVIPYNPDASFNSIQNKQVISKIATSFALINEKEQNEIIKTISSEEKYHHILSSILLTVSGIYMDEYFDQQEKNILDHLKNLILTKNFTNILKAEKLAENIPNNIWKSAAFAKLAIAYAKNIDFTKAEEIIAKISDEKDKSIEKNKSVAVRKLAIAYAKNKYFIKAEEIIAKISDEKNKSVALRELAIAYSKNNDFTKAEEIIEKISDEKDKSVALRELAIAYYAENNDFTKAEETIAKISDEKDKSIALRELAITCAKNNDFTKAEEIIKKIPDAITKFNASKNIDKFKQGYCIII